MSRSELLTLEIVVNIGFPEDLYPLSIIMLRFAAMSPERPFTISEKLIIIETAETMNIILISGMNFLYGGIVIVLILSFLNLMTGYINSIKTINK
jgi:hypothetical protein